MKTKNRLTLLLSALAVLISAPAALADVQRTETTAKISQAERMDARELRTYVHALLMEYSDVEKEYLGEFATDDVEFIEERAREFAQANLAVLIEIDALLHYLGELEDPQRNKELNRRNALERAFEESARNHKHRQKNQ
jgi:hypothetical protein